MTVDSDSLLAQQLDAAIPQGTAHLHPAHALAAGRAAARRGRQRRVTAASIGVVGVCALALPLGGLVSTGSEGRVTGADVSGAAVASQQPAAPSTPQLPATTTDVPFVVDPRTQSPYLDETGGLVMPPGAELVEAVLEPLGHTAPAYSIALAYLPAGPRDVVRWTVLSLRPEWRTDGGPTTGVEEDGSGGYEQDAEDAGQSFAAWVDSQIDLGVGPLWPEYGLASEPYLARADGRLVIPDGARVLDSVIDPVRVPEPASSRAVAWQEPGGEVRWTVMVVDPTWTSGGESETGVGGLVNGFGAVQRDLEPGVDFRDWVDQVGSTAFVPDSPPAWVG